MNNQGPQTPIVLHPSSAPLFWLCPSSQLLPRHSATSYPAMVGTCLHKMVDDKFKELERELEFYSAIYGVDEVDLYWPWKNWQRIWNEIKQNFPAPISEQKLDEGKKHQIIDNVWIEGTLDLADISTETYYVCDWKFGHLKGEALHQAALYAWLLGKNYGMPKSGLFVVYISWVTRNEVERYELTVDQLKEFRGVLNRQAEAIGKAYNPGEHCVYCSSCDTCERRLAWIRSTGAILHSEILGLTTKAPEEIGPHDLVRLYPRVKMLEKLIETYKKAVRSIVEKNAGQFALAEDGLMLSLDEVKEKSFDFKKTLPLLRDMGLTSEEINSLTAIGKTAMEKIIRAKAPRGKEELLKKDFYARARAIDCYTVSTYTKLALHEKPAAKNE